jgi:hypothetical protein
MRRSGQPNGLADNSGVGGKTALPQRVAEDDDCCSARPHIAGEQRAAEERLDAEHVERAGSDCGAADAFRLGCVAGKVH